MLFSQIILVFAKSLKLRFSSWKVWPLNVSFRTTFFQSWAYSNFQSGDDPSSASFKFCIKQKCRFSMGGFSLSPPRTLETYLCNQTWVGCAVPLEDFTDSQPHPSMLKLSHFLQNCHMYACAYHIKIIWSMMFRWQSRKVFPKMSKYQILCGLESLSSKILIDMESKEQTFNGQQMKGKKIKEVGQNSVKLLLLKEDKVDSGFIRNCLLFQYFHTLRRKATFSTIFVAISIATYLAIFITILNREALHKLSFVSIFW